MMNGARKKGKLKTRRVATGRLCRHQAKIQVFSTLVHPGMRCSRAFPGHPAIILNRKPTSYGVQTQTIDSIVIYLLKC